MYALKKKSFIFIKKQNHLPTKNNNNKYTYFFLYNFSLMITIIKKKIKKKIKYFLLYMYKNNLTDKALMILLYQ